MNEALSVSDYEYDKTIYENDIIFDVIMDKEKNTETQVDAEEAVENE